MYTPYQNTWQNPYLPLYNQGQPVQPMAYQQPVNGIVRVNGRDSALQYQLPPNSTSPALFDASGTCFYVVSTDGTGTKSLECFDFAPHQDPAPVQPDPARYVSRDEFVTLSEQVESLREAIAGGSDGANQRAAAKRSGRASGDGQGQS